MTGRKTGGEGDPPRGSLSQTRRTSDGETLGRVPDRPSSDDPHKQLTHSLSFSTTRLLPDPGLSSPLPSDTAVPRSTIYHCTVESCLSYPCLLSLKPTPSSLTLLLFVPVSLHHTRPSSSGHSPRGSVHNGHGTDFPRSYMV